MRNRLRDTDGAPGRPVGGPNRYVIRAVEQSNAAFQRGSGVTLKAWGSESTLEGIQKWSPIRQGGRSGLYDLRRRRGWGVA